MTKTPLILGFATSGPFCSAALVRGDEVLASVGEDMARGQAERLMGLLDETLQTQDVTWADLDGLGIATGPGNFTGIRIGVAAARGLALGLGIPAYGVTGFQSGARLAEPGRTVVIPAPRDMVYVRQAGQAHLVPRGDVATPAAVPAPEMLAQAVALHAVSLWPASAPSPAPYYVRAPDAAPARDAPPTLLE